MNAYQVYLNAFGDARDLTNSDFSDKQLQHIKQAIYNRMFEENNNPIGYYQKRDVYNSKAKDRDKINTKPNAVGYGNYASGTDIPNILGRFYYNVNPNGEIMVNDLYNFDHNTEYLDPRRLPAIIGRKYGKPFNINLNLGNPNTWGNMKYTGNSQLGI